MANGFTLGGISQGFNQARDRQRKNRLVSLQEEQFETEQQQAEQQEVMESIKLAFDQYGAAKEAGVPPQDALPLLESALETAELAQRSGINAIDPELIRGRIQAEQQAPGREEQLERKAEEEFITSKASAAGTAAGTPQKPITISPGQRVIDAEGNLIAQAPREPKTFTLSAGERVVDETGSVIAEGGPEEPDINEEDVDVILPGGDRVPAKGRIVDGSLELLDQSGQFRPARQVFPDAQSFEQARTRTQDIPAESKQFTREDFVRPIEGPQDIDFEKGVGPLDATARTLIGTPVLSQIFTEFGGEGEPQRRADRLFKLLENQVLFAFRPSEDGRVSNLQLELAKKLVPSFGAFAQERGSEADLRQLRDQAESLLENQLFFANNPGRFDSETVSDATARAQSLGKIVSVTDALLNVKNTPQVELTSALGKPLDQVQNKDLQNFGDEALTLSEGSLNLLLDNLSEEQQQTLRDSMQRSLNGQR